MRASGAFGHSFSSYYSEGKLTKIHEFNSFLKVTLLLRLLLVLLKCMYAMIAHFRSLICLYIINILYVYILYIFISYVISYLEKVTIEKVLPLCFPTASYFCLCIIDACSRTRKLETVVQSNFVGGDRSRQKRIN